MNNNDIISKKEFLKLTGISYAQLYRWKRENLIPEDWFMKKSSFTGQETYFPKEKVIKRVKLIQTLKDKYSLEELAAILSPELSKRTFSQNDIYMIPGIDVEVIKVFQKHLKHDYLKFTELLFAYTLCKAKNECKVSRDFIKGMVQSACKWLEDLKSIEYFLLVCSNGSNIFILLIEQKASFFIDNTVKVLMKFQLDEVAGELDRHLAAIVDDV